jgi:hypothetical protein
LCGAYFAADRTARKDLLGVERAARIENVAQARHRREVVVGKHERQRIAFFCADSVLARDRAAERDARREDLVPRMRDCFDVSRDASVEEQQRMEIPIARVEDVAHV